MKPAAKQPYRVAGRGSRVGTKAISFTFDGKAFDEGYPEHMARTIY